VAQQPIELILMRHLASRLAVPVFIVDAAGDMVYFNEPAERVLGRRFNEVHEMPFGQWTTAFLPQGENALLSADDLPLVIAVRRRRPAHREMVIVDGHGASRPIGVSAFPVEATDGRLAGAVAMFWETQPE
jgi:PAS domain-containing protein